MKIAQRYIGNTVFSSIALVTLILFGLQLFIILVGQINSIGRGDYGIFQAFVFVSMQACYQLYLFFPVACVLGCLMGLGQLANHSELIVMRASGASIRQITVAVLKTVMILIFAMTLFGELALPKIVSYSNDYRSMKMTGGSAVRTARGIWLRDDNRFIHIDSVVPGVGLFGITEYLFNPRLQLQQINQAKSASYHDKQWQLHQVAQSMIHLKQISSKTIKSMPWQLDFSPRLLAVSSTEPQEMNLLQLHHYVSEQKRNRVSVTSYELNYWQRIFQPIASIVMLLLAIPFIFGPLRSTTIGVRIIIGATVGFGFHLLNEFFGPLSLVYQFPPLLAALMPTLLFAILAVIMLRRVR